MMGASESAEEKDDGVFTPYKQPDSDSKQKPKLQMQLMSDVHIEFRSGECSFDYEAKAPYLGLLGDIGVVCNPEYSKFLASAAKKFKNVFLVLGNHEYYNGTMSSVKEAVALMCKESPNVIFLDRGSVLIDGVRVLGCTLWTKTPPGWEDKLKRSLTDFHKIYVGTGADRHLFTVAEKDEIHDGDVRWLAAEIAKAKQAGEPVLVLTHHAPTLHHSDDMSERDVEIMKLHSTNLHRLMGAPVHTWCFGHVHWNSDQLYKGTRLVCNQRGYPTEAIFKRPGYVKFDPALVIDIN